VFGEGMSRYYERRSVPTLRPDRKAERIRWIDGLYTYLAVFTIEQ
jgi:hypothetical protein